MRLNTRGVGHMSAQAHTDDIVADAAADHPTESDLKKKEED